MKYTPFAILALSLGILVSCNKERAAIDASNETTQKALNQRKEAVTAGAKEATKQTDVNATIDKANIEANKTAAQAQLDAEKKKADAETTAEKARVDAEKK
ncbi:MAG: hypothetical protein RL693_2905 [Verrucomicrobiota bacterium]|jgi:cell wall-associated NlpC family hydrolase